jgi:ATP-dependent DNA helicase RecG
VKAAVRVFSRIARDARAWIKAPRDETLAELERLAREATALVPEARRGDWEKLLAGFGATEDPRRRARVEGLVRACALFDREERARERRATPLAWDEAVQRADGIGPTAREKLAEHGVGFVADLVWTLPVGWDDLRAPVSVQRAIQIARDAEATLGPVPRQCIRARVKSATLVPMRGRRAVRVVLGDGDDGRVTLDAWWFYVAHGVLSLARQVASCLVVGRLRVRDGKRPSLAHPDLLADDGAARGLRPRYPALGVSPALLRRGIGDAVARVAPLPDPIPAGIVERERMPDVEPLLRTVHGIAPDGVPEPAARALAERLAWVEAFTRVWQRIRAEAQWGEGRAPALPRDDAALGRLRAALGFALTAAQERAVEAVARDLASPAPMRRLVLGDVGTGKTAIALAAAAQCVTAGYQCALLVPTGVLCDQYADALAPLVSALGVRVERLTAGMRAADRRQAIGAIADGHAQVALGTHALLQEDVSFPRLGLVVVDEQQRLGVAQRLTLVRKGEGREGRALRPHLLSLSATPIPRTLALALRGELATSVLDERPRGRPPVATELAARNDFDSAVVPEMRAACERGERVFFVCPRIEDEPEEEEVGAMGRGRQLAEALAPARVAVVHGAMPPPERARAMRAFRSGEVQVLVGTSVLEVGIDVPEATLMVIDGADQFGLAQLHQLRGRVGRGDRPGRCILLHEALLVDMARRRLETLARTSDGAEIARQDLALRGAGELGGTRQSGVVEDFLWLNPSDPPAWIDRVEDDARALLERDPGLAAPEHRALAITVRRFAVALSVREEAG